MSVEQAVERLSELVGTNVDIDTAPDQFVEDAWLLAQEYLNDRDRFRTMAQQVIASHDRSIEILKSGARDCDFLLWFYGCCAVVGIVGLAVLIWSQLSNSSGSL